MKRSKWFMLPVCAVIILMLAGSVFAANSIKLVVNGNLVSSDVPPQIINGRTMVPIRWVAEALGAKVNWNDAENTVEVDTSNQKTLERRVTLLQDWIAPISPMDAVTQWADAVKMRNGAVQFALFAPSLQEETKEQFAQMGWVTGVSSPWVERYTITNEELSDEGTWEYEVQFNMKTSTGDAGTEKTQITVRQSEDHWFISDLHNDSSPDTGTDADSEDTPVLLKNPRSVQMIDENIGWVWGWIDDQTALMKTIDGGKDWQRVSLGNLLTDSSGPFPIPKLYFFKYQEWVDQLDERTRNDCRTYCRWWTTLG